MTLKPYSVYINGDSGTVLKLGRDALSSIIKDSPLPLERLTFVPAAELAAQVAQAARNGPVLVGGGDGTIRACAQEALTHRTAFGILPLGTMNLMARDLGLPLDLPKTLESYAEGAQTRTIDVGHVNDRVFLCCAGVGTMPESSEFREQNRDSPMLMLLPRLTLFVLEQMAPHNRRRFSMHIDGRKHKIRSAALVIANNLFTREIMPGDIGITRGALDRGLLGVYSASPANHWDKIRLLWRLRFGNWHDDAVIREWRGRRTVLETANKQELISLDGETETLSTPLDFRIIPRALDMLVPIAEKGRTAAEEHRENSASV